MSLFNPTLTAAAATAIAAAPTVKLPPGLGGDAVFDASLALDAVVSPAGMVRPFLPHQAAAYAYALDAIERWGSVLIGDDMGLGKTQVALALIALYGKALVVAPSVTRGGYVADLQAAFPTLRFHHLFGRKADFTDLPDADVYFITDDTMSMRAWLTTPAVDSHGKKILVPNTFVRSMSIVVRDELHRDKGNMGKAKVGSRADIMFNIGKVLRQQGTPLVGMTGTLLLNRPVEAYLPLQILGGDDLVKAVTPGARSKYDFLRRYTNPTHNGWGWNYNGVNIAEMVRFNRYLRETLYVRREKRDIPTPLPMAAGWSSRLP